MNRHLKNATPENSGSESHFFAEQTAELIRLSHGEFVAQYGSDRGLYMRVLAVCLHDLRYD
ncbi:hypothetical protein [Xenorhabdus bovienii]|uniref:hypothetical protein n=1 Tax=Xenorhabdus bovienii TaxID=40576 RepID=UPI003DA44067